jgi:sarcosine oxidase
MGLRVLGIDRHDPPHTMGSTHAETRITRLAVGEGREYLPLVARSHEIWRQLEAESGVPLLHQCGGMIIASDDAAEAERWTDFVGATERIASNAGIGFRTLSADQINAEFPTLHPAANEQGGNEPTAGLVMCEDAVRVQLELARAGGAAIRTNETVTELVPIDDGVVVRTSAGDYEADRVIATTGPWSPDLADPVDGESLEVTRQLVVWYECDDLQEWTTNNHPFVMWIAEDISNYVALFPSPPGGTPGLKAVSEQFSVFTDPKSVDRTVSDEEIADLHARLLAHRVSGVTPNAIRAEICLYTNTDDEHFLIDAHPASDRITTVSACSGHGFKHSTAIGEALAEQVARGASTLDLEPFRRRPHMERVRDGQR